MHSRIYQVTTRLLAENNYLKARNFLDHWFTNTIADYVSNNTDRVNDIRLLKEFLADSVEFDSEGSFVIQPGGKEKYFQEAYTSFKNACQRAALMDLSDFVSINDLSSLVFTIKNEFCDEYSVYVSSDEFDTIPLDEFIRQAEIGKHYFIGGTLDYHF